MICQFVNQRPQIGGLGGFLDIVPSVVYLKSMAPDSGLDLLLVNPGNRRRVYQSLGTDLAAIEPPLWCGMIATVVRNCGFRVRILDAEAEELSPRQVAEQIASLNPGLTTVVVYGHQPSASTQNMTASGQICSAIKEIDKDRQVLLLGGHVSALPERTLREESADFVREGEGPATVIGLLEGRAPHDRIPGLWYRSHGQIQHTPTATLLQNLDRDLPQVAWDLLPMDKYRAHNWHCFGSVFRRQPYASVYTSLGCPYKCSFCCINAPFGRSTIRYHSPDQVIGEIDILVKQYGVRNLKIADEMFVLDLDHVTGICDRIIERGYDLNIWAYARVDTVKDRILEKLKLAGFRWLALGIESGSQYVRDGASKKFGQADIVHTVRAIQSAGISVIGNFIFGLPDDTLETLQQTLDMAVELNCEFANFYSAMAYPGSPLYSMALKEDWPLPDDWDGFSQHSVKTLPLPTKHLPASEVLRFRDRAFQDYFRNPRYLSSILKKFGDETAEHVKLMASHSLERAYA